MDTIIKNVPELTDKARKESVEGIFGEAFRKAALADYDLMRIPGIEKVREAALATLNGTPAQPQEGDKPFVDGKPGLKDALEALEKELGDHSKHEGDEGYRPKAEVRSAVKKLEGEIRKHEEFILQCDEEIVNIRKGAQTNKQVAANLLDRIRFIESYSFDLAQLPTARPEEAVQPIEKIHDPKTADQPLNPEKAKSIEGAVSVAEHAETTPESTLASTPAETPAA